jgi:hypothetical protein
VRQRAKHRLAVGPEDIAAIEEHGVDVGVALEVRARSLHDRDASARARALLVEREHHRQQDARDLPEQLAIVGEPVPHGVRERQHPLAKWSLR